MITLFYITHPYETSLEVNRVSHHMMSYDVMGRDTEEFVLDYPAEAEMPYIVTKEIVKVSRATTVI